MQGYDYGVRPVIAIAGDWLFTETWSKADYVANYYGIEPQHGFAHNVPFVAMIFENEIYGRKLFEDHFLEWVKESDGDGDAVGIDFIEWKNGRYTMVVYPNREKLIERLAPKHLSSDEVQVLALVAAKGKEFTSKEGFLRFKDAAKDNVILLMGGTDKNAFDYVIRKLRVNFYEEGKIPQDSMSLVFENGRDADEYSHKQNLPTEDFVNIKQRRERALSRYFPVTLERIRVDEKFLRLLDNILTSNYKEWQVTQAFCNLTCSLVSLGTSYFEGLSEDQEMSSVYHLLEDYFETPAMDEIPQRAFDKGMIIKQIMLDSIELLQARQIPLPKKSNPKTIQNTLRKNGLL